MATRQVQTSLTEEQIAAIDRIAESTRRSRSFVIAMLVMEGLDWAPLYYRGEVVGRIDPGDGMAVASAKASGFRLEG